MPRSPRLAECITAGPHKKPSPVHELLVVFKGNPYHCFVIRFSVQSLEIEAKETWVWQQMDLYVFHAFRFIYWYFLKIIYTYSHIYIFIERALQAEIHLENSSDFMFNSAKRSFRSLVHPWNKKNNQFLHQHTATNTQQDFLTTYTTYSSYFLLKPLKSQPSLLLQKYSLNKRFLLFVISDWMHFFFGTFPLYWLFIIGIMVSSNSRHKLSRKSPYIP